MSGFFQLWEHLQVEYNFLAKSYKKQESSVKMDLTSFTFQWATGIDPSASPCLCSFGLFFLEYCSLNPFLVALYALESCSLSGLSLGFVCFLYKAFLNFLSWARELFSIEVNNSTTCISLYHHLPKISPTSL